MLLLIMIFGDSIMTTPEGRDPPNGPYKGIANQNKNQQQESNIVNQQKEKGPDEERVDLLPCRAAPEMKTPHIWERGQKIEFQNQWNNPHASFCELNLVRKDGNETKVFQVVKPFECGGGFQRQGLDFYIPENFPKCEQSQCFLQYYAFSLEPRDYVTCADFIINGDPSSTLDMQPFKVYNDGKDFDEVSNDYNPYRGQAADIPYVIKAIWDLLGAGEFGDKAVELEILTQEKKNFKQQLKGISKGIQNSLEGSLRPSIEQNREVLDSESLAYQMGEKAGKQTTKGYFPPVNGDAYGAGLTYNHMNAISEKQEAYILSKPLERELQTTYIPLPDKCLEFGVEALQLFNSTKKGSGIQDSGAKCAEAFNLEEINRLYYEAIAIQMKKRMRATGTTDMKESFNHMLFSSATHYSIAAQVLMLLFL